MEMPTGCAEVLPLLTTLVQDGFDVRVTRCGCGLGVVLEVGPVSALTPDLMARIRANRDELRTLVVWLSERGGWQEA